MAVIKRVTRARKLSLRVYRRSLASSRSAVFTAI